MIYVPQSLRAQIARLDPPGKLARRLCNQLVFGDVASKGSVPIVADFSSGSLGAPTRGVSGLGVQLRAFGGPWGTKCVRVVPSLGSLGPSEGSEEGPEAQSS